MSLIRKLILSFLVLTISLPLLSCGKKTSLFPRDRADSSWTVKHSEEVEHKK
jgi:hypothetical protein